MNGRLPGGPPVSLVHLAQKKKNPQDLNFFRTFSYCFPAKQPGAQSCKHIRQTASAGAFLSVRFPHCVPDYSVVVPSFAMNVNININLFLSKLSQARVSIPKGRE